MRSENTIDIGIKAEKLENEKSKIINATVGVLRNDSNEFYYFRTIYNEMIKLKPEKWFKYPQTSGGDEFKRNILKWLFPSSVQLDKMIYREVLATAGATGAIYISLKSFSKTGDYVLVPNLCWSNYKTICSDLSLQIIDYDFLINGHFSCEDLFAKILALNGANNNKILLLINDPCHNPTGYSMSAREWDELINMLNSFSRKGMKIFLIHDLAYIDYFDSDYAKSRKTLEYLNRIDKNFIVSMCFSGSKTFCSYGLRIGAQVLISREDIGAYYECGKHSARAIWSTPTSLTINLTNSILGNENTLEKFILELEKVNKMFLIRHELFIEKAKKYNLDFYKSKGGFFISVKTNNTNNIYEKLCNRNLYTIPQNDIIRVAISSVPTNKIAELVDIIGSVTKDDY